MNVIRFLVLFSLLPSLVAASTPENPHVRLLDKAESMVTVKFVLKVKIDGFQDSEHEGETVCHLIDANGLVLCSNSELGGYVTQVARMGRGGGVSAAPSEIEILLKDDTEGRKGRLLVRDTDRDLAWLHLEEPLTEEPPAVLDLSRQAVPEVGGTVYVVRRLGEFLGSQPIVNEVVIGAITQKPRRLFVPSTPSALGFGLPVFTADGSLVGVTALQMPEDGAAPPKRSMALVGGPLSMQEMIGGLILPAEDLLKATELARETFADDLPTGTPE